MDDATRTGADAELARAASSSARRTDCPSPVADVVKKRSRSVHQTAHLLTGFILLPDGQR